MAKGITVSDVEHVSSHAISGIAGGASSAGKRFQDAEDAFGMNVADPITSKRVWSGGGQPDADDVLRINLSALTISHVEMQAAHTTLSTFAGAMSKARKKMLAILDDAEGSDIVVHENGSASIERSFTTTYREAFGDSSTLVYDRERIERAAKGVLLFAAIADACCTKLLGRITGHVPQYSNTADPSALAANGQTLGSALYDRQLANANKKFWDAADPRPMPESPGALARLWNGLGNFASYLWHNPGEAATLAGDTSDLALDIGLIAVGIEGEEAGLGLDVTGVGALVGVPVNIASAVLIEQGIVKGVDDASRLGNDAGRMNSQAQSQGGSPGTSGSATPKYPQKVDGVLKWIDDHNGSPPPGTKGGRPYRNDPAKYAKPGQQPGEKLPDATSDGKPITYKEYDVNQKVPGNTRDKERIVVGDDGSVYYTDLHYQTFTKVR